MTNAIILKPRILISCFAAFALTTALIPAPGLAIINNLPEDLSVLSLEDLMNIEVTSVSKQPQKLSDSAAAIFVITQDDIRRSGVTSIPEALRLAPGVQVAHIDANKWSISVRGFNSRFSNKLLVLIDGRSVYTPLYSGVYWDVQDTMLEDIERIEVIRGPGATLWGANAVNGVINIISKNSTNTQGTLLSAGNGNQEKLFAGGRYGGTMGKTTYRVYGKYFDRDNFTADDHNADDGWRSRRGGFRLDTELSASDFLTVQGDIYENRANQTISITIPSNKTFSEKTDQSGGNLLLRWQRTFSQTAGLEVQTYYDQTEREEYALRQEIDIYDIDLQHYFQLSNSQKIIWGMGYRFYRDDLQGNQSVSFSNTNHRDDDLFNAFVQDDITLVPQQLHLILGSKLEHNDYTGYEIQPNGRLLWTPNEDHSCWAAISRAVRTPSRVEHDAIVKFKRGVREMQITGSNNYDSEDLLAYELGYRFLGIENISFDIAAYYSDYDDLQTIEATETNMYIKNMMSGAIYGLETVIDWQPIDWWRLQATYAYENVSLDLDGSSTDTATLKSAEGDMSHNIASLRSSMDLAADIELDIWFRYVDALREQNVDSYINMDVRLGWLARPGLELSLVGQNLLDNEQPEYNKGNMANKPTEVTRGIYVKATWSL